MKFFENRALALLCTAAIVFGSTVLNLNRSIDRQAERLEAIWDGKYGVEEKLKERCSNASQLWSVISRYDTLTESSSRLRSAYNALYDTELSMLEAKKLFSLNAELTAAAEAAMHAAERAPLTREDRDWAERYYGNMTNAQRLIEQSDYNQAQRQFSQYFDAPHVQLLRPFLDRDLPEQFAD